MPDLTIRELAEVAGLHVETVRRLARLGRIPGAYRIGEQWRVNRKTWEKHRDGVLVAITEPPSDSETVEEDDLKK